MRSCTCLSSNIGIGETVHHCQCPLLKWTTWATPADQSSATGGAFVVLCGYVSLPVELWLMLNVSSGLTFKLTVLALLSKGHTLHFDQSPLIALTVCPAADWTEQTAEDQNTECSIWASPQIIMRWMWDDVMVIIIFMVNLIAWHDMTFIDPEMYEP